MVRPYIDRSFYNERQKVTLKVLATDVIAHIRHRAWQAACAADGRAFIVEQWLRHVQAGGQAHVPDVHTEALAGHGETRRWMSAAAGASGDRVIIG